MVAYTTPNYQKRYKSYEKYSVNPIGFIDCNTPESAYILGFIYADGHIRSGRYKNKTYHQISISILADDAEQLKPIFLKTGKWAFNTRKVVCTDGCKRRQQTIISTSNRPLVEFLEKNDYLIKSETSADKILSIIPNNLRRYFFLGLIDGDGHWGKIKYHRRFILSSSYKQDWSYVEKMLTSLCIKYTIFRRINNNHRNSALQITNINNLELLYKFLYPNGYEFGLCRKHVVAKKCSEGRKFKTFNRKKSNPVSTNFPTTACEMT